MKIPNSIPYLLIYFVFNYNVGRVTVVLLLFKNREQPGM